MTLSSPLFRSGLCWCLGACVLAAAAAVYADAPSVSYIFPAGGQRGTTVKFRVGGHYLHGSAHFDLRAAGLTASERVVEVPTRWFEGPLVVKPDSQAAENYPRDHAGEVTINFDAPLGDVVWRVWTSQGATAGRPFVIGHLPEVLEDEIDGRPVPQYVTLPVTANGRIFPREDVDIWTFDAEAGQPVTCEVHASRIASPIDSHLEIRGPQGERIVENDDHSGTDSWLRFTPRVSGKYQAHIRDVEFRGLQDYVYRLTITAGPYVDRVFPLGGRRGETVQFQLLGQNVPGQPVAVTLPADRTGLTAVNLSVGGELSNKVLIDVGDLPEVVEASGSSGADQPSPALQLPLHVNGCIRMPGEIDRWTFHASQGQVIECELWSARLGSRLDAVVTILDSQRKALLQVGSTADNPVEPRGTLTIPADGDYTLEVRDVLNSRGGADFAYRLRLGLAPGPDFRLSLASDALTLPRGGEAKLKVIAERSGGFAGEIKLQFNGIPEGVTLTSDTIAGDKSEIEVIFKADAKSKVQGLFFTVDGTAKRGDETVLRRAFVSVPPAAAPRDSVLLSVAMPTPFQIDGGELQLRYGARGTIFRRKFAVVRNGYSGPLTIRLADRQIRHLQGVTGPTLEIGPEVNGFVYPVRLPTWLETNRTCRTMIMVSGEVADADGTKHMVSFSSGETQNQIALLTAPCPLNIRAERSSVLAVPRTTRELRVSVSRGTLALAPVTVELILPEHVVGVSAEALVIATDENAGVLRVQFGERPGPFTMSVVVRATTLQNGDPVVSETKIEFVTHSP